jgi:putative glutamine amidotransferase
LISEATGPDNVIEAISAPAAAAPVFAVQWHPEWRPEDRPHDQAFFAYLGESARAAMEGRMTRTPAGPTLA